VDLAPADFWKLYDVGSVPDAANTAIAIFAVGDVAQVVKDVATNRKHYKLPTFPVTVIQAGPGPFTDVSGQTEFNMDTQTSTGIAGTVKELRIYTVTSSSDGAQLPAYNQFVM